MREEFRVAKRRVEKGDVRKFQTKHEQHFRGIYIEEYRIRGMEKI